MGGEGLLSITVSAVIGAAVAADSYYKFSSKAIGKVINWRPGGSGGGGSGRYMYDGGTAISASSPSSKSPNRGVGSYGSDSEQPDQEGNYNQEDAIKKLLKDINKARKYTMKYIKKGRKGLVWSLAIDGLAYAGDELDKMAGEAKHEDELRNGGTDFLSKEHHPGGAQTERESKDYSYK